MLPIIKTTLLASLLVVFLQDLKAREVYWFLFPVIAVCCAFLHYGEVGRVVFLTNVIINSIFIGILLLVVYIYSKFKLKTTMKNTFGMGDTLLFLGLAFSFSSMSFLVLFVFALIFSLTLHLFLKKRSPHDTVPLAGYMSLFFMIAYVTHWLGGIPHIYSI